MNILLCALEFAPILKVGGVADVIAGLANSLAARGHTVTVALPCYHEPMPSEIRDGDASIEVVGLAVDGFAHDNPYGHEVDTTGEGAHRLAQLTHAVVDLCIERAQQGRPFSVVHVHDWPLAMVPWLLASRATAFPNASRPPTVLTIHNAAFHGLFPQHVAACFGLSPTQARQILIGSMCSTLAGGILSTDVVTTVSPSYATEILNSDASFGFAPLLQARARPLHGILNGIELEQWEPSQDRALPHPYGPETIEHRALCKSALLQEVNMPVFAPERPLVVFAGRLFHEKGADLLAHAIPSMVAQGAQVLVAGKGDDFFLCLLLDSIAGCSGHAKYVGYAPEPLMRRLLAAADIVLIPSRREACGLVQMYAQRYGAIPVAHRTGGLADTIVDPRSSPEQATGFLFDFPSVKALLNAFQRALTTFATPAWTEMQRRCMQLDRCWSKTAAEYEQIYRSQIREHS